MDTKKPCRECGQIKPLSEYYALPRMADGHLNKCKTCVKARVNAHREKNIERIRIYDRARSNLPHRLAARKRELKKLRAEHPEKDRAHDLVGKAIKKGVLHRQPCVVCGKAKAHAHHHDYSKPLAVIWLCAVHHSALHHGKLHLAPP